MPISAKSKAAPDTNAFLHVVVNGYQYLSEYIKSPDHNMASALPRPSDPTSLMCRQSATDAINRGDYADAIKMLDFSGTEKVGCNYSSGINGHAIESIEGCNPRSSVIVLARFINGRYKRGALLPSSVNRSSLCRFSGCGQGISDPIDCYCST
jgi:hypothetical protein